MSLQILAGAIRNLNGNGFVITLTKNKSIVVVKKKRPVNVY